MDYKEEFIRIINEQIHREGAQGLLSWMQTTDFFTAPASTKFHCACEGGLVQHSLSVYHTLMERYFEEGTDNPESFAIAALLHDLCKANFYKPGFRNVKLIKCGVNTMGMDYDEALAHGQLSLQQIRRYGGEAVLLWHNTSFANKEYHKKLYTHLLNDIIA